MADKGIYYSEYLQLDKLLHDQESQSEKQGHVVHDEMFFIIVHQVYELWFKSIINELDYARDILAIAKLGDGQVVKAESALRRVVDIIHLLIEQLPVIETMSAMDFMRFRDLLGTASGMQSVQFRLIEHKLGLRHRYDDGGRAYLACLRAEDKDMINIAAREPSLLQLLEKWLAGAEYIKFDDYHFWDEYKLAVAKVLNNEEQNIENDKDLSESGKKLRYQQLQMTKDKFAALFDENKYQQMMQDGHSNFSFNAMRSALFIYLYREETILQLPYRLLITIIDIDEQFANWRQAHSLMAQRMIGSKMGTGGSSGYEYLRKTVQKHRIFAELKTLGFKKEEKPEDTEDNTPQIAVVGRPNVGKSSLVNAILNEDKLVVSDIPGTTVDTTDSEISFEGQRFLGSL